MDTPLTPAPAPTAVAPTAPAAPTAASPAPREQGHPLIWAALLVWLSVEAIGDGLLALRDLLASVSRERSVTPS